MSDADRSKDAAGDAPTEPAPDGPGQAARTVPCPTCGRPAVFGSSNHWRPFCSERCRSVDLGAWASEQYRVPSRTPPDEPGAEG